MTIHDHPDALTVTDESQSPKRVYHLVVWAHERAGDFGPLWQAAIDGRGALASFFMRRASALADTRLSASAMADDQKSAALEAVRELGEAQRRLNAAAERLQADRLRLAGVSEASPAEAVIDVAIAQHFRSLAEPDRQAFIRDLVDGAEPRAVEAVLRMPRFLVGLSVEMTAVIRAAAIRRAHPKEVDRLGRLGAAAQTAQHVLRRASEILESASALSLEERMRGYGDQAWQKFIDGPRAPLEALARTKYGMATAE